MEMNLSVGADSWEMKYQELLLSFEQERARVGELYEAVESRDVIGQAKGILMERHKISDQNAFDFLVRISNGTDTKLYDVAAQIVRTVIIEQS